MKRRDRDVATCLNCMCEVKPHHDSIRLLRSGPNAGKRARVREFFCLCGRTWADVRPVSVAVGHEQGDE